MEAKALYVACPACEAALVVDAASGEILSHRVPERPVAGGKDFDRLLDGLDEQKARAEALFEQEKAALKNRGRILEQKFEEAMKRVEQEGDDGPPIRPWDLD